MADLLAKQDSKQLAVTRGQEIEGTVVAILTSEIILDLGTKAEGVLQKKDLQDAALEKLKVGDKLTAIVIYAENDSGQTVLSLSKGAGGKSGQYSNDWQRFIDAKDSGEIFTAKGLEVNKGGLIVEIAKMRGFLPSSQVSLSKADNLDELIGQNITVKVIEADPKQNRLILSQQTQVTEEVKDKISSLKAGDEVSGKVAAVLPFGIFVSLEGGVEGLVHISELSWEKVDEPGTLFKVGDEVSAKVISTDQATGRVNLSVKQLSKDPFSEKVEKLQPNDVIKGEVTKVSSMGVFVILEGGAEGLVAASLVDSEYKVGESAQFLIDSIDTQKRRVNLAPFVTTTKGLIYK
jgi:small subunit ribosomal protein S1